MMVTSWPAEHQAASHKVFWSLLLAGYEKFKLVNWIPDVSNQSSSALFNESPGIVFLQLADTRQSDKHVVYCTSQLREKTGRD
jgi:hypothetical protein